MPIPQQRDPEDTRRRLTAWLRDRLPEARDLELTLPRPPEATGFSSDTLLADASWTEGGVLRREGLVFRARPTGYAIFPEYDIELQFRVLERLAPSPVPVPTPHWFEPDEAVLGAPFYAMARVDGRVPADNPPYHMDGWVTEITAPERAAMWWSGLETMAAIHTLDWRGLGLGFLADTEAATGLDRQLGYYERYLEWAARGRPQPTTEAALAWLREQQPSDDAAPALVWGDARIGNMIFDDRLRCAAVLDWEMVTIGDPEMDLAWFLFLDRHHSEGVSVPRLEGFPNREETVARWAAMTGRTPRNLEWFEVFAGFRFAIIMARLAQMLVAYEFMDVDAGTDFERDNIVTQLLAKMLDLPPPGEAPADG